MPDGDDPVRLTALSHGAGCACKLSLDELTGVLDRLAWPGHPDLVVGVGSGDDAAVWRQPGGRVLVATTDFFTPIVDDAATWGRIAAANAASDVYAMGAQPMFALNLVGWPRALPFDLLEQVLTGAADIAHQAGYPVVGGHSIDSAEPLYGQVVLGQTTEAALLTNAGARVGQHLVLTKPLGTGIVTTAVKRSPPEATAPGGELADSYTAAVTSMTRLNDVAAQLAVDAGATAATDVTGFGLLGHLHRLAAASGVACRIDVDAVGLLPGVTDLVAAGFVPGGTVRNRDQAARFVTGTTTTGTTTGTSTSHDDRLTLLCDAQTSGGLLVACAPDAAAALATELVRQGHDAAVIGEVVAGAPGMIELTGGAA